MKLLWAPGMSESAKEISRNLTGREKAAVYVLSLLFGICVFSIAIVFAGSVMAMEPFHGLVDGIAVPLAAVLSIMAGLIIILQRRLMAGSRFARENGIAGADIVAKAPPSRIDHMVLAAFVVLAIANALAAVLTAS